MKKACLYVNKVYQRNEIFSLSSTLNRDNCLKFFHELKQFFSNYNIDLHTQDLCSLEEAEYVIYSDIPKNISSIKYPEKSILLLFECEVVRPNNWDYKNHRLFKFIFSWNDNVIDNKKYFKFNFTGSDKILFKKFSEKNKLCTMIAGNKFIYHPQELYSKRIEAIKWFEKNQPNQFDFYGLGWEHHVFKFRSNIIAKIFNKISFLTKLLAKHWPQYRGSVKSKLEVLQNYKFSICYENAKDIKGYITEKIFDSMSAGCIPIYWGAPNISEYVPKDCYIDRTDFLSYEELFTYISEMTEEQYNNRLLAIEMYMTSDRYKLFEPKYNARIIVENVLHDSNR